MARRKRIYGKRRKRTKSPLKFYGKTLESALGNTDARKLYRAGETTGGKILDVVGGPLVGGLRRLFKGSGKPQYHHATMGNPANRQKPAPTYTFPGNPDGSTHNPQQNFEADGRTPVGMRPPGQGVGNLGAIGSALAKTSSPMKKGGKGWDRVQTGLSIAGTVFPQADLLNALVSTGRAGYAKATGDDEGAKKHIKSAGINTLAILPGVGESIQAVKGGKILKTKATKQITDATKSVGSGGIVDKVATGANVAYWGGTADQIRDDVTGGKDNTPISVREKEDLKNPKNIT